MYLNESGIELGISDGAARLAGLYDVTRSEGTFVLTVNDDVDISAEAEFVRVRCDGYHFQIGVAKERFYLLRNGDLVSVPLPPYVPGITRELIVGWAPEELAISLCLHRGTIDYSMKEVDLVDEPITDSIKTEMVLPPVVLSNWVRLKHLKSSGSYHSRDQFRTSVFDMISHMKEGIASSACHRSFWDYSGKVLKPKPEPQLTRLFHALMMDQAAIKGIEITPQAGAAGGNLDFQATGFVEGFGQDRIAIEAKYAHSSDLEAGIAVQLPTYMKAIGADTGVYLVLWAKSEEFLEPAGMTIAECFVKLTTKRPMPSIHIDIMEVAPTQPPSQRSRSALK